MYLKHLLPASLQAIVSRMSACVLQQRIVIGKFRQMKLDVLVARIVIEWLRCQWRKIRHGVCLNQVYGRVKQKYQGPIDIAIVFQ